MGGRERDEASDTHSEMFVTFQTLWRLGLSV